MEMEMEKPKLREAYESMRTRPVCNEYDYYLITIVADENGNPSWSTQTQWAGFADEEHKIELREASIVCADRIIELFRIDLKEGCVVVDTSEELSIFLLHGGHAVVEKSLTEKALSEFLKPHPTARTGFTGFQSTENMPNTVFQRAPTKKQRGRVLKRDEYRCKICGRAPCNNVDVTLHVHHIRPWADRGLTHDDNLITLCHTCHEGLDPHYELSLYALLEPNGKLLDSETSRRKHIDAVRRYYEESFKRANALNK